MSLGLSSSVNILVIYIQDECALVIMFILQVGHKTVPVSKHSCGSREAGSPKLYLPRESTRVSEPQWDQVSRLS